MEMKILAGISFATVILYILGLKKLKHIDTMLQELQKETEIKEE